jgi:hypothetical protein
MNRNKFLLGGLLGTLIMYLLGGLIYGQFAHKMIGENSMAGISKIPVDSMHIIFGDLAKAFLLAYVFECWARIKSFLGGVIGGSIIGLLSMTGDKLVSYGMSNTTNLTGTIIDIIAGTVMFALSGGVIGWFLGYNRKQDNDPCSTPRYF